MYTGVFGGEVPGVSATFVQRVQEKKKKEKGRKEGRVRKQRKGENKAGTVICRDLGIQRYTEDAFNFTWVFKMPKKRKKTQKAG